MAENTGNAADGKSSGLVGKVIGIVFGAVIAPVLVALAVKYLGPSDKPADATAKQDAKPHEVIVKLDHPSPPPSVEVKKPLTSGNLVTPILGDNFYSYAARGGSSRVWVRGDPPDAQAFVFAEVPPGPKPLPSIRAVKRLGAGLLATKEEFENYTLSVWFRWGDKAQNNKARQGALLLHCTPGTDGQFGRNCLPQCVAVLLTEGMVGSLKFLGSQGAIKCKAAVQEVPGGNQYVFDPDAPATDLATTSTCNWNKDQREKAEKLAEWDGTIYRRGFKPEEWKNERGDSLGPWTQLRIECGHGNMKVYVGTELANELTDCTLTRGRIGLPSLQAEWYIGKLEVTPRPK